MLHLFALEVSNSEEYYITTYKFHAYIYLNRQSKGSILKRKRDGKKMGTEQEQPIFELIGSMQQFITYSKLLGQRMNHCYKTSLDSMAMNHGPGITHLIGLQKSQKRDHHSWDIKIQLIKYI